LPDRDGDAVGGVGEAVERGVVRRGVEGRGLVAAGRALLVEHDRAGVSGRVGRLLHGAPRRVQLTRVDGEADDHHHRERRDRDEHDRLTAFALAREEESPH